MRWLLCALLLCFATAAHSSRRSTELAAGWLFVKGDPTRAADPAFDDGDWTRVTLPHTFNANDGEQPDYYRGPAWYRRTFEVRSARTGRRLFIQFDGAATAADVYLNGKRIGRHEGGHARFRFDLTPALVTGRNLLAVRVDNSPSRVISPLGGDFTVFGGLYRQVSLIETEEVHFDLLDHGGPGVQARTSEIGAGAARIRVAARVANDGDRRRRVPVVARIIDAGGKEVARAATIAEVPPHGSRTAELAMRLPSPRRWDGVRDPYLYRVAASIDSGDEASVPLGIRTFTFDPMRGFILNGRPYPLRGANLMHSARPGKGTAVTGEEIAEDFAILREMGSTAVRLVHFQHPERAYEEADRLGLVAWTEIGVNGQVEDTPEFRANAAQQLRELIAQAGSHPSVVMWGLGNEVYSTEPHVARILSELNGVAKAADPDRPTVYAHCCQADDHPKALVTDVIGFNRYFGWYPDQKGTIGEWAERFHRAHPGRAFAVSEYGAGASILHQQDPPGEVVPASGWHPEQFQTLYHERNWLELKDKPYVWGTFVWVAFDLASAGRHEGDRRGINDKGLVTYDRKVRKDSWYWYQANWSDRPMLHITSRRFTVRHEPQVEVKAYTNAGPATLFVNGVAQGTQTPVDRILRWPVRLRRGKNRIEVRGSGGLVDAVDWTYEAAPSLVTP
jgi:beta-galactosidase